MSAAAHAPAKKAADRAVPNLTADETPAPRRFHFVRSTAPCLLSMLVHATLLIVLSLLMVGGPIKEKLTTVVAEIFEEAQEDLQEVILEEDLDPATDITPASFSNAPIAGLQAGLMTEIPEMRLDQSVVDEFAAASISVDFPAELDMSGERFIVAVPDGTLGESRAVVDNYQHALSRVSQELIWMLEKRNVLVVWLFDQSGSMKDDQQEIRARVYGVYEELGLTESTTIDALSTAVASYGERFEVHTPQATSDLAEIKAAITAVPVDESGKEMMCRAVGQAITRFQQEAKRQRREMALILVTDESGDPANNLQDLERAIAAAKDANCRIYVMGREASFGYPYVYIRYTHPQTNVRHWLKLDRGPETGFPEQLQTNGFWRRYDSFNSGFGPYEQARMARETNGVFFMLPTVEKNLVQGNKRRYDLEAKKAYRPDLRPRAAVLAARDQYPLRNTIWRVITVLNPYDAKAAKRIVMAQKFSLEKATFLQQAREQQIKARGYLPYLARAEKTLKDIEHLRQQEGEPRWQANYDLIYAQLVAYQGRMHEYMACLVDFVQNPKTVPLTKKPNLRLYDLRIHNTKRLLAEEKSKPFNDRATLLLQQVIKNHPGTPWAQRAQWELNRGFGVQLVPRYDPVTRKVDKPSPLPKL